MLAASRSGAQQATKSAVATVRQRLLGKPLTQALHDNRNTVSRQSLNSANAPSRIDFLTEAERPQTASHQFVNELTIAEGGQPGRWLRRLGLFVLEHLESAVLRLL